MRQRIKLPSYRGPEPWLMKEVREMVREILDRRAFLAMPRDREGSRRSCEGTPDFLPHAVSWKTVHPIPNFIRHRPGQGRSGRPGEQARKFVRRDYCQCTRLRGTRFLCSSLQVIHHLWPHSAMAFLIIKVVTKHYKPEEHNPLNNATIRLSTYLWGPHS